MTWNAPEHDRALHAAVHDAVLTLRDDVNVSGAEVLLAALSLLTRSARAPVDSWQIARASARDAGVADPRGLVRQTLELWHKETGQTVTGEASEALRQMPVDERVLGGGEEATAAEPIRELFLAAFRHRDVLDAAWRLAREVGVEGLFGELRDSYDAILRGRLLRSICINDSRASIAAGLPPGVRQQHWHWNDLSTLDVDALAQHALGELHLDAEQQRLFDQYLALDPDLARYLEGIATPRRQVRAAAVLEFRPRTQLTLLPPVAREGEAPPLRLAAQDAERWHAIDVVVPPANVTLRLTASLLTAYIEWPNPPAAAEPVRVTMADGADVRLEPGARVRLGSLASLKLRTNQPPREWVDRLEELQLTATHDR